MKINPITLNNNILKTKTKYQEKKQYGFNRNYLSTPVFRGKSIAMLYDEYNWYINCDRIPAVNSFLKIKEIPSIMNKFLTEILSAKDRGYEFIESIVNQPRNSRILYDELQKKLGENSQLLLTFIPNSPYNNAYNNFIERKFNNASVMELLKIRPDWRGEKLIEKQIQDGYDNFVIGKIPRQIGHDHLYKIYNYLKDKMEVGIKYNKKIDNLVLDGKTYEFKYFTEGKSSKNVFGIFVPSEAKKYVMKMEPIAERSLDAPFALGTLAKIDGYLTFNRSRNSAPLCFYDHDKNFSLYKYIEHANITDNTQDINFIRSKLPDFKVLGLEYNDTVGYKNFFILNEKSIDTHDRMEGFQEAIPRAEWISVDNDHVTYSNIMQPGVTKYHTSLPNAMQMFF